MMNHEQIAEAEARAKAATEGPWRACGDPNDPLPQIDLGQNMPVLCESLKDGLSCICGTVWSKSADLPVLECHNEVVDMGALGREAQSANAIFVAHARTDVPRLAATARTAIELLRQYDELHGSSTSHLSVDTKAFLAAVAQKGGA